MRRLIGLRMRPLMQMVLIGRRRVRTTKSIRLVGPDSSQPTIREMSNVLSNVHIVHRFTGMQKISLKIVHESCQRCAERAIHHAMHLSRKEQRSAATLRSGSFSRSILRRAP